MVEQAAEAVVTAAARGTFLPGDRLVEAEIARELGISRVPVREALRLLESQGIVVSTPYKGMRLMQVDNRRVAELTRVRVALESLAVRELCASRDAAQRLGPARQAAAAYGRATQEADRAVIVAADVALHAEICRASGNAALHWMWSGLARQLSVIWSIGHGLRPGEIVQAEHEALLDSIGTRDVVAAEAALLSHVAWHEAVDFDQAVAALKAKRG